jgi:hypothetical protein
MRWQWRVGPSREVVEVEYGVWSGRKRVLVGGQPVARGGGFSVRWTPEVAVGGALARITFQLRWLLVPDARLEIGGRVVAPSDAPRDLPAWVWLFGLANAAILIVALGGAIPGALAGGGVVGCVLVARSGQSLPVRLALCAAITAAMWIAFVLIRAALS